MQPCPQRPRSTPTALDWSKYGNKPPEKAEGLRPGLHISPVARYPQAVTYSVEEHYE